MVGMLKFYISNCVNPYINLATEKYLFDRVEDDSCILYLWQNQNTVVIGKNQNALVECRTELLREEGGMLARRLSGGGAVFHDLGNLNFTFLCSAENFDIGRHMRVIKEACALAGIDAEISGRNDILTNGKKFSGNAFYHSSGHSYHHGTLLICADMDKMQRYLTPPSAKLVAKGIKSVKSRVVNLAELSPGLTCEAMKDYLLSAFQAVYGMPLFSYTDIDEDKISAITDQYSSPDYIYGSPFPFDISIQGQLSLGNVELQIRVEHDIIHGIQVYTDALDETLPQKIKLALMGVPFKSDSMSYALSQSQSAELTKELTALIKQQVFD